MEVYGTKQKCISLAAINLKGILDKTVHSIGKAQLIVLQNNHAIHPSRFYARFSDELLLRGSLRGSVHAIQTFVTDCSH